MTCEFTWHQLKHRAQEICYSLNQNRPSEMGKLSVDCKPSSFTFQMGQLPVDALHVTALNNVAKIVCHNHLEPHKEVWQLYYFDKPSQSWAIYPCANQQSALELLNLLELDPNDLLWDVL